MPTDPAADPATTSSRTRILDLLRRGARTVDELAGAIDLTANAVRAQLVALERDGLVRKEKIRYGDSAGKPPWTFAITAAAEAEFSRAYVPALTALAATLAEEFKGRDLRRIFDRAGKRLAELGPQAAGRTPPEVARSVLESLGAVVVIDASQAPTLVEGMACPLADAVRSCPESCEMVRSMLASATGARVATRCAHGEAPRCRFAVG